MTKLILIPILIFYTFNIESQNLNSIKKNHVFFVVFEENDFEKKVELNRVPNNKSIEYSYSKKSPLKINKFDFSFKYTNFKTYDDALNTTNKVMSFKINKSCLRKNKDIIITRKFMMEVGENAIINLLYNGNKKIFLIDKSEIKNRKILLREVRFHYIPTDLEPNLDDIKEY